MEELLYSDTEREYFLLDYSPSHSEMVIRSINKNAKHNIDLFFKAVYNINLATKLNGITVYKVLRDEAPTSMLNSAGRKEILKITDSNGYTGYVDASVFVVFHNHLDILETSLGDFTWSNENNEITSATIN